MPQVSVRDPRREDRSWIQSVYREYLADLAPSATGLFPALPDVAQGEPDQWARFFTDQDARVLTVCFADEPVGFAKLSQPRSRAGAPPAGAGQYSMAEFFIAKPWRRRGIGEQAVRLILDRFEGAWLITEHVRNDAAVRFWRHVVRAYTGGDYRELIVNGEVQQRFLSGRRRGEARRT